MTANGYWSICFGGDEVVLKLGSDDSCTTLNVLSK